MAHLSKTPKEDENLPLSTPFTPSTTKRAKDPASTPSSSARRPLSLISSQPWGEPSNQPKPWQTRHVKLPFDLRNRGVRIEGPVVEALFGVFPDTVEVGEGGDRVYLCFHVKNFPEKPWPLTVAGLPFTIHDGTESVYGKGPMFPVYTKGNMLFRVCHDINARTIPLSDEAFRRLTTCIFESILQQRPEIGRAMVEVILSAEKRFYIVLEDHVDIPPLWKELPGRVAQCWTMYLNERDLCRPSIEQLKAQRDIIPDVHHHIVDDTPYSVLRPGVLISCPLLREHGHPAYFSTTTGVLVKDVANNTFMTSASHGIGENEKVYQHLANGDKREIGTAVLELTYTDIAMVKLDSQVEFVNDTFEHDESDVPPPPRFTRLFGEVPDETLENHDSVYLNSPFTGALSGVILMKSCKLHNPFPFPSTRSDPRYIIYDWTYTGQADLEIPQGVCGSVIWDSTGRVTGFFHYMITTGNWKGFYTSVSAHEVVNKGYRLA